MQSNNGYDSIQGVLLTVSPEDCDPPHGVSHPDKVIDLANQFVESGWNTKHPRLIAYPFEKRLQLLSGSHRWIAARLAHIQIPVVVSHRTVQALWGTDGWKTLMKAGG